MMAVDIDFDGNDENDECDEIDETNQCDAVDMPGEVKKLVLDDRFWQKVNILHDILQPVVAALTKIESDDLVIHNAHEILGKMFATVEPLIQSATVFDAKDKRAATKCLQDRKKSIMIPIILAASILNPADLGSKLTHEEMDGIEFIFKSAKSIGCDKATI